MQHVTPRPVLMVETTVQNYISGYAEFRDEGSRFRGSSGAYMGVHGSFGFWMATNDHETLSNMWYNCSCPKSLGYLDSQGVYLQCFARKNNYSDFFHRAI